MGSPLQTVTSEDAISTLINKVDRLTHTLDSQPRRATQSPTFCHIVSEHPRPQAQSIKHKHTPSRHTTEKTATPKTPLGSPLGTTQKHKKLTSDPKSLPRRTELSVSDADKILNGEPPLNRGLSRVWITGYSRRPKFCDLRSALKAKGIDITMVRNMMWVGNSHLEVLLFAERSLEFVNFINNANLKIQATTEFDPLSFALSQDGADGLLRLKEAYKYAANRLPTAMTGTRKELNRLMKEADAKWKSQSRASLAVPTPPENATMMESS